MAVQQGEVTLSGPLPPIETQIDDVPVHVFDGLTITDPNVGALDTAVIGFDGTAGRFSTPAGYSGAPLTFPYRPFGFDQVAEISDETAAALSSDLEQLVYTPQIVAPGSTIVYVSVSSSAGGEDASYVTQPSVPSGPAISFDPTVSYSGGVFTLTGRTAGITFGESIEITAQVDGVATDLGAATVDANGNFSFEDAIGAHKQEFFVATVTNDAGGTATSADPLFSLAGGLADGKGEQYRYTADGSAETATDLFKANGSQKASLFAPGGETFASSFFDTFRNGGAPESTFVFDPGFGRDVVSLFRVDGTDHDTLSFKGADYGNSIATVLNSSRDTAAGLLITDPTASSPGTGPGHHDTLLLKGITKEQLSVNTADIEFHT